MDNLQERVRLYTKKDARRIIQLEYTRFDEPLTRSLLNFFIKKYGSEYFYVLDLDGNGMVDAYIFGGMDADDWMHVISIAVLHEFEGKGVGKFLIKHLLEQSKDKGLGMRLEVNVQNQRAIKLYENLGFKEIIIAENYYGKGQDARVMELKY